MSTATPATERGPEMPEVNFEDLLFDIDAIVQRLKQEVHHRHLIEDAAEDADEVTPAEFNIYVEMAGCMLRADPDLLPFPTLAPLIAAVRGGSILNTTSLLARLNEAIQGIEAFRSRHGVPDDGQTATQTAPAQGAPEDNDVPPVGLLATLQRRRGIVARADDGPAG